MYTIDKQIDFCYGHRVWSQKLNENFATDMCLACRHLHGHQGKIHVFLKSHELQDGMVTDFKHLGWFKKWIDDYLDHKMILDKNDPALKDLFPRLFDKYRGKYINLHKIQAGHVELNVVPAEEFDLDNPSNPINEILEGLVFVDFVPTSENLSKWLAEIVQSKMYEIGVIVDRIEFFETPKSRSTYTI